MPFYVISFELQRKVDEQKVNLLFASQQILKNDHGRGVGVTLISVMQ